MFDPNGEQLGKVRDFVVILRHGGQPPRVVGLVVEVGARRRIFLPITRVTKFDAGQIVSTGVLDLRRFKLRPGETLAVGELFDRTVEMRATAERVKILDLAMQQTQMALDADPNHAKAIGVMARVYHSDGSVANLQKARQLYQKALAMDGTDMALHHQYAMFLTAQKEYQAAIQHFGIAGEHIGYADRVIALENLAYLKVEQVRMLPTDAHYQAATLAIDRAINAGSQLGDQMRQTLSAYWLSAHQSH